MSWRKTGIVAAIILGVLTCAGITYWLLLHGYVQPLRPIQPIRPPIPPIIKFYN